MPKLGAFIVKQPSGIVRFSELMRTDDGVLRSLLVAYGISSIEANGMIDRMVFEIRHAITVGEEFTIDGLGKFRGGDNNNILFRCEQEPLKVGGNIKPPIEALILAQQRLRRSGVRPVHISSAAHSAPQSRRATMEATPAETSITKPDNYLRGLNYEKTKGRKHSEDSRGGGSRSRNRNRRRNRGRILPIAVVVILLAATIIGAWYLWQRFLAIPQNIEPLVPDSSTSLHNDIDSLVTDSLMIEADTLAFEPNNDVIE